jgi:hypothetical protein
MARQQAVTMGHDMLLGCHNVLLGCRGILSSKGVWSGEHYCLAVCNLIDMWLGCRGTGIAGQGCWRWSGINRMLLFAYMVYACMHACM